MRKRQRVPSSDSWTWDLTTMECVRRGWHLERVDWVDRHGYSHDLFGVFDALAWPHVVWKSTQDQVPCTMVTYAIQFTSAPNRAARRKKVEALPILPLLKAAGWIPLVWAWRIKDGKPVLAEDEV